MDNLATFLLTRAAMATVLGCIVALVARRIRHRPQLIHALWIAVLLQLLAPPVLRFGVLPRPVHAEDGRAVSRAMELPLEAVPVTSDLWGVGTLGWISLAGSGALCGLVFLRARRFDRALRRARIPAHLLSARVAELAAAVGLERSPRVRLVEGRISPLLRPSLRGLELVFPEPLLARLSERERDTLLVHELAHVRRRDPWARLVELVASVAFWWHPLVYGARSALRRTEEQACDAWVLLILPGHARDYAQALVKTVEWLAGSPQGLPVLASGVGSFHSLEERLTMILKERTSKPLSRGTIWLAASLTLAALLFFPTWAERGPARGAPEAAPPPPPPASAAAPFSDAREKLEREMVEIERQLMQLQERHATLAMELAGLGAPGMPPPPPPPPGAERLSQEAARRDAEIRAVEMMREAETKQRHASTAEQVAREAEMRARLQSLGDSQRAATTDELRREIEHLARKLEELQRAEEKRKGAGEDRPSDMM